MGGAGGGGLSVEKTLVQGFCLYFSFSYIFPFSRHFPCFFVFLIFQFHPSYILSNPALYTPGSCPRINSAMSPCWRTKPFLYPRNELQRFQRRPTGVTIVNDPDQISKDSCAWEKITWTTIDSIVCWLLPTVYSNRRCDQTKMIKVYYNQNGSVKIIKTIISQNLFVPAWFSKMSLLWGLDGEGFTNHDGLMRQKHWSKLHMLGTLTFTQHKIKMH